MKFTIKTIKVDLTPSLRIYVEEKMEPLDKFIKRFEDSGDAEILLSLERVTQHHKHGDVFGAKATVVLPHKILRAEEEAGDVRSAIDMLKDTLRLELEKYKERFLTSRRPRDSSQ
ncbi:MAG: ribosome-associated translation inhibitor RaiA [bacterium]|nr:ribosome-associated translation inhibitor RaiA [bacterium]